MKNNIYLSTKYFFRNKKNYISLIIVILLFVVATIIGIYWNSINYLHSKGYKELKICKTLDVYKNREPGDIHSLTEEEYKSTLDELYSIKNITSVANMNFYNIGLESETLKIKDKSDISLFFGTNESINKVIIGENFSKNSKIPEIICPRKFYPNQLEGNINRFEKIEYIDLKDEIGQSIDFIYPDLYINENYNVSFKLIGLYPNNQNFENDYNICYTNDEHTMMQMYNNQTQHEDDGWEYVTRELYSSIFVIEFNSIDNKDQVKEELEKKDYSYEERCETDKEYLSETNKTITLLITVNTIIFILFIIVITIKTNKENQDYYELLESLGYQRIDIFTISFLNTFITLIIGFIISIILGLIIFFIINKILDVYPVIFDGLPLRFDFLFNLLTFVIGTLSSLIITYLYQKRNIL